MEFRAASADDAGRVARLHADSWRRHYRGAYADAYLDGDVISDRHQVWSSRLAAPDDHDTRSATILAEEDNELVGFVHVIFDDDPRWGSLVDNLHVTSGRHRSGIGSQLMSRAAHSIIEHTTAPAMYLWVLEQNSRAQSFYRAIGGQCVETADVPPPGGDPTRLNGTPKCHRYAWPNARLVT